MRIDSWQELEDFTCTLLQSDRPKKPANSGGTKKEEDVVSRSIIAQCKHTGNNNMSILKKDLDRLLDACKLQQKAPLFVTSNTTDTVVSIPVTDDTEEILGIMLKMLISWSMLQRVQDYTPKIETIAVHKIVQTDCITALTNINTNVNQLKDLAKDCMHKLDLKFNKLIMHDLFE